jgi:hypothetical protein
MIHDDDDADDPCVDCALDRCHDCMLADPAPLGSRECCCGLVADVTKVDRDGGRP